MEKLMSRRGISFAFLFALALSLNIVTDSAWAAGGFSETCQNARLQGGTLSASCQKASGSVSQPTSINIDRHIANANGRLSWGGSDFSKTCNSVTLKGSSTLEAVCKKVDGFTPSSTSINLDEHIANIDGSLKYEV